MKDLRFSIGVVLFVALCFGVFYGGASALSAYTPWHVRLDFDFERQIPFVPWMAVVYLSMDLLVGVAPFVLREPRKLAAFAALLIVQMVIGACFFVLMPVENVFPPRVVEGGAAPAFWLADTLNLERNYFPSLHVAFSFTAARAYRGAQWWLWAIAIAASTLLIHEHYLVDVVGGLVLALTVHALCFERFVAFDFAEATRTEWLVFTDFARFAVRHRRYLLIDVVLYALAFPRFRERRVLRTGFALLQVIDDVLDGDRPSTEPPLELAARIATELETQQFSGDHLGRLAAAFHRDARPEAIPVTIALIHTMRRDRERVETKARWSQEQLRTQLRETFVGSLDVLLICGGSKLRAADVPALVEVMGWCSAVRDLDEDLGKGLCNVPAGIPLEDPRAIATWLDDESTRARPLIDRAEAEVAALPDRRAAKWLGVLARSTRKYLRTTHDRAADRRPARLDA